MERAAANRAAALKLANLVSVKVGDIITGRTTSGTVVTGKLQSVKVYYPRTMWESTAPEAIYNNDGYIWGAQVVTSANKVYALSIHSCTK